MNSRKEMIPAPHRELHKTRIFCKPEWDLLCKIRMVIQTMLKQPLKDTKQKLGGIIGEMDDVFEDWPEDPK